MHQRSVVRVGASLLVASLALTACGSRGEDEAGGGTSDKKVAKIGVIAPLSGDLSALGLGIQHSVELAVKQANDSNAIDGLDPRGRAQGRRGQAGRRQERGDRARGRQGRHRRRRHAELERLPAVQPVLSSAKIAQVSPANTEPGADPGRELEDRARRAPTRGTSGPAPPTRSRARSRPGTCSRRPGSRRSRPSTTRRHTARVWSRPSPRSSRAAVVRSFRGRPSTRTTPTTRPSSPR